MRRENFKTWLAPVAAVLSLVACYGSLAALALLGLLGITIALNEAVWAGTIMLFAALAVLALALRWRHHGLRLPLLLAVPGFVLIAFAMIVSYSRGVELAGFALLGTGTLADLRGGRSGPA